MRIQPLEYNLTEEEVQTMKALDENITPEIDGMTLIHTKVENDNSVTYFYVPSSLATRLSKRAPVFSQGTRLFFDNEGNLLI